MKDEEEGTRSVTDERGALSIETKNEKKLAMYHTSDGKSWLPDDKFLPASAQTSDGLIKGGRGTGSSQDLIPIHWKIVDANTGADILP